MISIRRLGATIARKALGAPPVVGAQTSIAALVGACASGPIDQAIPTTSFQDYVATFGPPYGSQELGHAVQAFFQNGGRQAYIVRVPTSSCEAKNGKALVTPQALIGVRTAQTGLYALEGHDFNLLCMPDAAYLASDQMADVLQEATAYCAQRRAFCLIDPPTTIEDPEAMVCWIQAHESIRHPNAAMYFPRLVVIDAESGSDTVNLGPCGAVAGVLARTDAACGVWTAPVGAEAQLLGAQRLAAKLTTMEAASLLAAGVNPLQENERGDDIISGMRTLVGANRINSDWRYVAARRLALFIEESLVRNTAWAASQPNNRWLWARLQWSTEAFLYELFRQGAFQGTHPREAYFVRCDRTTTPAKDLEQGLVHIIVGLALIKPGAFIMLRITQATREHRSAD